MDAVRQERFLHDLQSRCELARTETDSLPESEWARFESIGCEGMMHESMRMPRASRAFRQITEAMVLLHPHLEVWKVIQGYAQEILDAPPSEQNNLLQRTVAVVEEHTRMPRAGIIAHIYAFWPVSAYVLEDHTC